MIVAKNCYKILIYVHVFLPSLIIKLTIFPWLLSLGGGICDISAKSTINQKGSHLDQMIIGLFSVLFIIKFKGIHGFSIEKKMS